MRQWRRREDEQQVRRVSGAWPPPGTLSPNRSPRRRPPRPAATPGRRRRRPSRARAAGWIRPGRLVGRRGLGRRGAGVPGTPGPSGPRVQRGGRAGGGWSCRPGGFRSPSPAGAGCQLGGRAETSAVWVFPQPIQAVPEFLQPAFRTRSFWPGQVTPPLWASVF